MSDEQRDEHVKALLEHHAAQRRRESDRAEARARQAADCRTGEVPPADVRLRERRFGVLEEGVLMGDLYDADVIRRPRSMRSARSRPARSRGTERTDALVPA